MFSKTAQPFFSNWHPMRWITLILGLILGYNWFMHSAQISGVLSVFLLFQAFTNTGCLAGQCMPSSSQLADQGEESAVEYEEIKK
jgi:hypothetical protein